MRGRRLRKERERESKERKRNKREASLKVNGEKGERKKNYSMWKICKRIREVDIYNAIKHTL